jgi:hypothetical protein
VFEKLLTLAEQSDDDFEKKSSTIVNDEPIKAYFTMLDQDDDLFDFKSK